MTHWRWVVRLLTRRVWFRAALFCLFAVALALAGAFVAPFISYDFAVKIGSGAVDNILGVLATSMLAVTTFSLTAMVSAYAAATSNITPRAVQLLVDDTTAQNALATFLGSFLFAIAGIIALSTGLYGETGRVFLYAGTILVIIVIAVTFLRWIEHVTHFGRVSDMIERVERAAAAAVETMAQRPCFGEAQPAAVPEGVCTVRHHGFDRVTHVDYAQLARVAEEIDGDVHVTALPGAFADPRRVIAWTRASADERQQRRIHAAFTFDRQRAFDHDPRFGLVVLSEISSRALSPAVNDPGTAIAAIEAGSRVLAAMLRHRPDEDCAPPPRVHVPPIRFADALGDLFRPIARDGAGMVEVGLRLQDALAGLRAIAPEAEGDIASVAADALARARPALENAGDRMRIEDANRSV